MSTTRPRPGRRTKPRNTSPADAGAASGTRDSAQPAPDRRRAERWLPRTSLRVLVFLAVLWTAYIAKAILFPIVLAVVLYFLLNPLSRSLCRLHIPPLASAAIVVLGGLLVIGMGMYFLYLPASQMIAENAE